MPSVLATANRLNESYSLMSFMAGFYALLFVSMLCASAADTAHVLNLSAWFSWHVVLCVLWVVGFDPTALHACVVRYYQAPTTQQQRKRKSSSPLIAAPSARFLRVTRVLGAVAAMLQTLAFAIWATVLWTRVDTANTALGRFYGVAAALLYAMSVQAMLIVYVALLSDFDPEAWLWTLLALVNGRIEDGGDNVYDEHEPIGHRYHE